MIAKHRATPQVWSLTTCLILATCTEPWCRSGATSPVKGPCRDAMSPSFMQELLQMTSLDRYTHLETDFRSKAVRDLGLLCYAIVVASMQTRALLY